VLFAGAGQVFREAPQLRKGKPANAPPEGAPPPWQEV